MMTAPEPQTDVTKKIRRCPKCGSTDVYADSGSSFDQGIYRCRDCRHAAPKFSGSWLETTKSN